MRTIGIVLLLMLSGCFNFTIEDALDSEPFAFTLTSQPADAAHCVIANAEKRDSYITGRIDKPPRAGAQKLVIRQVEFGTIAVALIEPAGTGSTAKIWMRPMLIDREGWARSFADGC